MKPSGVRQLAPHFTSHQMTPLVFNSSLLSRETFVYAYKDRFLDIFTWPHFFLHTVYMLIRSNMVTLVIYIYMYNNDYTHEIPVYCVYLLHFNNVQNIPDELVFGPAELCPYCVWLCLNGAVYFLLDISPWGKIP